MMVLLLIINDRVNDVGRVVLRAGKARVVTSMPRAKMARLLLSPTKSTHEMPNELIQSCIRVRVYL